jgi:RNA polymerase sigma-70 factor (ECF subfamily)
VGLLFGSFPGRGRTTVRRLDDGRLLAGLRRRERWARAALIERYGTHVRRVLVRVLGAATPTTPICSRRSSRAPWAAMDQVANPASLKAWITRIAVFTARGAIRRRRRRRWLLFFADVPEPAAAWAGPDLQDAAAAVYKIFARMPVDERIPFALRMLEGMDLEATAEACGMSIATVRRRLARAERRFHKLAREYEALAAWVMTGESMSAAGELWRRLAEAQDALLTDAAPLRQVELGEPRRRKLAPLVALATAAVATGHDGLAPLPTGAIRGGTDRGRGRAAGGGGGGERAAAALLRRIHRHLPAGLGGHRPAARRRGGRRRGGARPARRRVVHTDRTRWIVRAGPFRVRVTGTRFTVTWSPETKSLAVALHEGSVLVDGALLGAGVPLRAASGSPWSSRLAACARSRSRPRPSSRRARRRSRPRPRAADWLALAERGEHARALASAERIGFPALCRRLGARELLALGDVARYAGANARARLAFEALVERFARDALAADATFSLGRLAFEAQQPREAARWFGQYVARWPEAPLAEQAAGRLNRMRAAGGRRRGGAGGGARLPAPRAAGPARRAGA